MHVSRRLTAKSELAVIADFVFLLDGFNFFTVPYSIVRLNLLVRLSLSYFRDLRAQKQVLSGLDRTSTGDEDGSTTRKF